MASAPPARVTVIGDSVQAAFDFSPQARRHLGAGIDLRMEARVCRRLTTASCSGGGSGTPESAIALVRRLGSSLGPVVVVNVGYNDDPGTYDIDAMLAALRAAGVRSVIWVTLREQRSYYATTNAKIRDRAARQTWMRVADWNAFSSGKPWFASDGLHLSAAGASGLADLIRREVGAGLASIGTSIDGRPIVRVPREIVVGHRGSAIAGDDTTLWVADDRSLTARAGDSGRRTGSRRPLGPGDALLSDGARAWLATGGLGVAPVSITARGYTGTPLAATLRPRRLVRTWDRLWVATRCGAVEAGCAPAGGLEALFIGSGERTSRAVAGPVLAMVAAGRSLWTAIAPPATRQTLLELRDPRTGQVRRSIPLPGVARSLAATQGSAWIVTDEGRLLTVSTRGPLRLVLRGVRAVISDGHEELWVLRSDRRTLVKLDPLRGRPVVVALARRPLSDARTRMTLTGRRLWVGAERGRVLVSVALGMGPTR